MTIRVLICGGTEVLDATTVIKEIDKIHLSNGGISHIAWLTHGGETPVSRAAYDWGHFHNVMRSAFSGPATDPEWKAQGIVKDARPDLVLVMPGEDLPAAGIVTEAMAAGIPVYRNGVLQAPAAACEAGKPDGEPPQTPPAAGSMLRTM